MKQRDQRKTPRYKPLKRLIHLSPQEVWSWELRGDTVLIRTPDHKTTHQIDKHALLGIIPADFEPWDWDDCYWEGIKITPRDVRERILEIKTDGM